jgi:organic hydroperoxide reductase OsmC/OhrA
MATANIQLRSVPGTEAAMGWAGGHTVVVDRPEGRAGGQGLGFNGAQLLGLAIGGCFCNDLRYVAHELGVALTEIAVDVAVTLEGEPLLATHAELSVAVTAADPAVDVDAVIARARQVCTVGNSVERGMSWAVTRRG